MDTTPMAEGPEGQGRGSLWQRWRDRPLTGLFGGDLAIIGLLITGAALLLFVVAGGGGSSTASAPAGGEEPAGSTSDQALAYAECIRENGVPEFPDPVDGRIMVTPESGVSMNSPEFQQAREACQDEAPSGLGGGSEPDPEVEEQVLAFAECMRENGIDFPDPDFSGGAVRLPGPGNVDFDSPRFQRAQEACAEHLQDLPGGGMRRGAP